MSADDAVREAALEYAERAIEIAAEVGSPVLARPFFARGAKDDEDAWRRAVEAVQILTAMMREGGTEPQDGDGDDGDDSHHGVAAAQDRACSFSVKKHGPQQSVDPWAKDCGNGVDLNKQNIKNDPRDLYDEFGEDSQAEWVQHLMSKQGAGAEGGVAVYSLDNEAVWWHGTHRDIHPAPSHYDEVRDLGIRYAAAIKAVDPTALVTGPAAAGWDEMFYSAKDLLSGWATKPWKFWSNPVSLARRLPRSSVPILC